MSEEPDYFLEIESRFATLRETPFVFSAKDWALMKSWKDDGIPLPIVLEAMESCFEKRKEGGRKRSISSLSYCRHAVDDLWRERKDLYVGKSEGVIADSDPRAQLEVVASELRRAAEEAQPEIAGEMKRIADLVLELGEGRTLSQIEEELVNVEQQLLERAMELLPRDEVEALERDVETQLASYRSADEATLERTRSANLKRLLRRKLQLPRLSLFG